jgi:transcriptional regulator with XRE-family HTH domain
VSAPNRLAKFAKKEYRDGFLRSQIGSGIAYQIQALRSKLRMTQQQFAEATGKPQTVISRLENSAEGAVTVRTLLDIATGANVALVVQFVAYPEFIARTEDMTDVALQPETIFETLEREAAPQLVERHNNFDLAGWNPTSDLQADQARSNEPPQIPGLGGRAPSEQEVERQPKPRAVAGIFH